MVGFGVLNLFCYSANEESKNSEIFLVSFLTAGDRRSNVKGQVRYFKYYNKLNQSCISMQVKEKK